jgi:hypothetical protein
MPGQFSQCSRNRKGDQKILNRQQLVLLPVESHTGFMILTSRAVAITAGLGSPFKASAIRALHNYFAGIRRSTGKNCADRPPLRSQQAVSVYLLKWLFILLQKIGKLYHFSTKLKRMRLTRLLTSFTRFCAETSLIFV